jgi:hypothetical protein
VIGYTCMLLCGFLALHLRAADRGCQPAPGLPCALLDKRVDRPAKLGRNAPRGREGVCKTAILSAISRTIFSVTSAGVAKHALLLAVACAFVFCFRLPMAWI